MKKLLLDPAGILIFIIFSILVGTYYYSLQNNIVITKSPSNPIIVNRGGVVEHCRTINILRDTSLTLSKSIIQEVKTNKIVAVYLPLHFIKVEAGAQIVCNKTKLPELIESGDWIIKSFVDVKSFPFWTNTIELPDIHISVKE